MPNTADVLGVSFTIRMSAYTVKTETTVKKLRIVINKTSKKGCNNIIDSVR